VQGAIELSVAAAVESVAHVSWSHAGRIRNEAAFAALGGVAPIPANSGQTELLWEPASSVGKLGARRADELFELAFVFGGFGF
jgi:hypothetical protein